MHELMPGSTILMQISRALLIMTFEGTVMESEKSLAD
jgi:hypothetical protein